MADPSDDDLLPISALNDLLFCERRCALHRNEQIWEENRYTLSGTAAHGRVHASPTHEELAATGRIVRGMWLRSDRLRLIGVADVVEFRRDASGSEQPFPVEFKHGKRRRWDNDDVQLCAQALCLEEMLGVEVPLGAIFHIASRRRREVSLDATLRELVLETASRLHELVDSGKTPPPVVKPQCRGCSLRELCMPAALSDTRRINRYSRQLYQITATDDDLPSP